MSKGHTHAKSRIIAGLGCAAAWTATNGLIRQPELFLLQYTDGALYCLAATISTSACSSSSKNCGVRLGACPIMPDVTYRSGRPLSDTSSPVLQFVRSSRERSSGYFLEVTYQNCLQADSGNTLFFAPCNQFEDKQLFWYQWDNKEIRSAFYTSLCLAKDPSDAQKLIMDDCSSSNVVSFDMKFYCKHLPNVLFYCQCFPGFLCAHGVHDLLHAIRPM